MKWNGKSVEDLNSVCEQAGERISELKDRWLDIILSLKNRGEKRMKINDQSFRPVEYSIKRINMYMVGVLEGEEGKGKKEFLKK